MTLDRSRSRIFASASNAATSSGGISTPTMVWAGEVRLVVGCFLGTGKN
jgi:hypothetical protein